ncbi:MAG: hypothetical protein J3Q66DRAFT_398921 [Benniella sp.]|nr:MAG: hypothetical protein J3Q66DRAFT_398921 [Benniella sp.]
MATAATIPVADTRRLDADGIDQEIRITLDGQYLMATAVLDMESHLRRVMSRPFPTQGFFIDSFNQLRLSFLVVFQIFVSPPDFHEQLDIDDDEPDGSFSGTTEGTSLGSKKVNNLEDKCAQPAKEFDTSAS